MRLPRRSFLRNAAVAAAGFTILPRHVLGRGFVPPSETLNHVIVGCGGISGSGAHFGDHMKGAHRVLAVCDVDDNHARNRVNQVKAAGGVRDLDGLLRVRALGASRCGATATAAMLQARDEVTTARVELSELDALGTAAGPRYTERALSMIER